MMFRTNRQPLKVCAGVVWLLVFSRLKAFVVHASLSEPIDEEMHPDMSNHPVLDFAICRVEC